MITLGNPALRGTATRLLLAFALLLAIALASPAAAERRVALVIGNAAYVHAPMLANPRRDATAVATALERLDFEVITGLDLDRHATEQSIRDFSAKVKNADVSLLFYAGHGLQAHGRNYLLPIDAQLAEENDLEFEAVEVDKLLRIMGRTTAVNLVFLDACRDNPLAQNLARSMGAGRAVAVGRGLAVADRGMGTLIAYATQPDNIALDGVGEHSPFAAALLEHIETPGLEVRTLLTRVRKSVLEVTAGKQQPWDQSSLTSEFYFQPLSTANAPQPQPPSESRSDAVALELAFWDSIKDSTNPANFEAYLAKYPEGTFAALAAVRLDELRGDAVAAVQPQSRPEPPEVATESAPSGTASSPEAQEQALALSEGDRRNVQARLSSLGFDPGGSDGAFGSKTREAITAWQRSQGDTATGYLSATQFQRLRNRPWLGVRIQAVNEDLAEGLHLPEARGAIVARVTPGGPAETAGIKRGDVILKFDGKDVTQMQTLPRIVAETPVSKQVQVLISRQGKEMMVDAVLGALTEEVEQAILQSTPAQTTSTQTTSTQPITPPDEAKVALLGLTVSGMSPGLREQFAIDAGADGVVITAVEPNTGAAEKGLRPGDVIGEVDQRRVASAGDVSRAVWDGRNRGFRVVTLLIYREGDYQWVAVKLAGD